MACAATLTTSDTNTGGLHGAKGSSARQAACVRFPLQGNGSAALELARAASQR